MASAQDRNRDATVYVGNLDDRATDALIWELFLQAGPVGTFIGSGFNEVVSVSMPKDRVLQSHQGFGFVEFATEADADYACQIMNVRVSYE